MILTVSGLHKGTNILKILVIHEETGMLDYLFVDTSDVQQLKELHQTLEEGLTYADFSIIKVENVDEGKDSYELLHYCENIIHDPPVLDEGKNFLLDELSVTGLFRVLIEAGGQIILPLHDVPEDEIPYWMIASPKTIQYSNDFGARVSHLVPSKTTEGFWRWISVVLFAPDEKNNFVGWERLKFLVPFDFDPGDFAEVIEFQDDVTVIAEDGTRELNKSFVIKDLNLPVYPVKSNVLMSSYVISRIKYIADSYKLALYTLTDNLFAKKRIERSESHGGYGASGSLAKYVKMTSKPPISKKTADTMLQFMADRINRVKGNYDEMQFVKSYPHYLTYESIIKPQINTFFNPDALVQDKMKAYHALKEVEAYMYLLLQECKYHMMFSNNAFYINKFTDYGAFKTGIPYYEIEIEGGGSGWLPLGL